MYNRVENILGLFDGAVQEVRDIGDGAAGSVRLGTITTSGAMILPKLLAQFHAEFPLVKFELWEADGARILELLDNRIIEIAITRTQVDDENYESIILPNEPLLMIMQKEKQFGDDKQVVHLEELAEAPLIIPLRWQSALIESCHKLGFNPNIICVSRSSAMDLLFVRMGLGVAMLPASAKEMFDSDNLVAKRLVDPEMTTHTVVSWSKNATLSGAAARFLEFFRKIFVK